MSTRRSSPFRLWSVIKQLQRWHLGRNVRSGPFRGMRFAGREIHSCYFPKLLGIFEKELHPTLETILARGFPTILNVGAAEGYYAVGMALGSPGSKVIAYETDLEPREQLAALARENGVTDRIEVRGTCEPANLNQDLISAVSDTVVFCDVEGYELYLLDPACVPGLARAWILVELHDFVQPGLTARLHERFAATHTITPITVAPRSRDDLPAGLWRRVLPERFVHRTVGEGRDVTAPGWLWMVPRT